jgi:hypothetical protein
VPDGSLADVDAGSDMVEPPGPGDGSGQCRTASPRGSGMGQLQADCNAMPACASPGRDGSLTTMAYDSIARARTSRDGAGLGEP